MVGKKVVFFALICLILSISIVLAFTKGDPDHSIQTSYTPGAPIKGWVNISFSNEPTTSVLQDSLGENISLLDLLNTDSNSEYNYSCSPSCTANYQASNGQEETIIPLTAGQSVLMGIKVTGNINSISNFYVNLSSNNSETSTFPLAIDILNDGTWDWNAYTPSGNFNYFENYGCFEKVPGSTSQVNLDTPQYCEKINLTRAPQVKIGAIVQGTGAGDFQMTIQKADGTGSGDCSAHAIGGITNEEIFCIPPDYTIDSNGDYDVCISSDSDNPTYKITYETNWPCGFSISGGDTVYGYDFELFAEQGTYSKNINFTLNDAELAAAGSSLDKTIENYIADYISTNYNNNCGSSGCIIPFKLYSGVNQIIDIRNLSLRYIASGISKTSTTIYQVQQAPGQINSAIQQLSLNEAGFHAPTDNGSYTFSVGLNDNSNLFSEDIDVQGTLSSALAITPNKTAVKYPTTFNLLSTLSNITSYVWDFGTGDKQTTKTNSVTYTYNSIGSYLLKITVSDNSGANLSGTFNITVAPASTIVPKIIDDYQAKITNIKTQLTNFSTFEQKGINNSLKVDSLDSNLTSLKNSISTSTTETQYETVLGQLLAMKIPDTIAKTVYSEGLTFYPDGNNINLDVLSQISGKTYNSTDTDKYKAAIIAWDENNANTTITYSQISAIYGDYQEPALKTFDVTIQKTSTDNAYFIIKNIQNLMFKQDYSQSQKSGYSYIPINQAQTEIVFSTTDVFNFDTLPMFLSPGISSLVIEQTSNTTPTNPNSKWILFGAITLGVIFAVIIIWIILQIWYNKKYENYLFKNKNNLYNLVNYIKNSKEKGVSDRDIEAKLRKTGWSSEQLRYVMRKYAGKKTGMPEIIPMDKLIKGNKKPNNSQKK